MRRQQQMRERQQMRKWGDGRRVVQRMRTANDVLDCALSWRVVTQIQSVCDSKERLSGLITCWKGETYVAKWMY